MPKPCFYLKIVKPAFSYRVFPDPCRQCGLSQKVPILGPFIAFPSDVLLHFFLLLPAWPIGNINTALRGWKVYLIGNTTNLSVFPLSLKLSPDILTFYFVPTCSQVFGFTRLFFSFYFLSFCLLLQYCDLPCDQNTYLVYMWCLSIVSVTRLLKPLEIESNKVSFVMLLRWLLGNT